MKSKAEQYNELIRMQMNSFQAEMDNTRKSEKKMSILRHDTRHHMAVLRTLIQQGDCEKRWNISMRSARPMMILSLRHIVGMKW